MKWTSPFDPLMPTEKPDTDPSTPSARSARGEGAISPAKIVAVGPDVTSPVAVSPTASTDPGPPPYMPRVHPGNPYPPPQAQSRAPSTDPGVAPPASKGPPPTPVAVPVPQRKNDSIELLLDGIAGDTRGKVAESRGEASLAYAGSEHSPPTPRKTPVPEAPVIVKRREMPPTMRLDRAVVEAAVAQSANKRPGDTTVLVPRTQGPRVVIALVAAIVVVLAVFLGMNAWSARLKRAAMAADPSASELVTSPPPGAWNPSSSAPLGSTPTSTATATSTATSTASSTSTPTAIPTSASTSTSSSKGSRPKAAATGTDLGEFKPSIHH
jgi:hypothetical protein